VDRLAHGVGARRRESVEHDGSARSRVACAFDDDEVGPCGVEHRGRLGAGQEWAHRHEHGTELGQRGEHRHDVDRRVAPHRDT
jgi:hypothetical protein